MPPTAMQRGQHAKSFAYGLRSVKAVWPTLPDWHQAARHDCEQFAGKAIQLRARNHRDLFAVRAQFKRGSLQPLVRSIRSRVPPEADDLSGSRKDLDRVQFARPDVGAVAIRFGPALGRARSESAAFCPRLRRQDGWRSRLERARRCPGRSPPVRVGSPNNNSSHRMADTRR